MRERSIRILYVETGSGYGGSMVGLVRLLAHLDRERFEPLVVLEAANASTELLEPLGVGVVRMARPFGQLFDMLASTPVLSYLAQPMGWLVSVLPQALRLRRFIRSQRIDVVHVNNQIGSNASGILAAHLCRVPCVAHVRNIRRLTFTERLTTRLIDRVLAPSELGRKRYLEQGIPADHLLVLRDPVHDPVHLNGRAFTRHSLGVKTEAPAVGILSRLASGKGHEDFLRAAAAVQRRFPDAWFVVVGKEEPENGPITQHLRSLAQELGLEHQMIFAGWRADIAPIIASLDIVVDVSTLNEEMRLTLLESMSIGKPVIATRVGAAEELFDQGRRGILIEPHRSDQLADAIVGLIEDPDAAARLGKAAQAWVVERHHPAQVTRQLEQIYETVLAEHEDLHGRRYN